MLLAHALFGLTLIWTARAASGHALRRFAAAPEERWPALRRRAYRLHLALCAAVATLVPAAWLASGRALALLGVPPWPVGRAQLPALAGAVALGGALTWLLSAGLGRAPDPARVRPVMRALLPHDGRDVALWLGVSVGAGVAEELVYRGFLPWYLQAWGLPGPVAVLAAAALFGVAHLYQGARGVVWSALLGLLFTAAYQGRGSLLDAMALHAAFDVVVGVAWWCGLRAVRTARATPAGRAAVVARVALRWTARGVLGAFGLLLATVLVCGDLHDATKTFFGRAGQSERLGQDFVAVDYGYRLGDVRWVVVQSWPAVTTPEQRSAGRRFDGDVIRVRGRVLPVAGPPRLYFVRDDELVTFPIRMAEDDLVWPSTLGSSDALLAWFRRFEREE